MDEKIEHTLSHIQDYCEKVVEAQARFFPTKHLFEEEAFYRDGCAFYVQQIGELVKDLPDDFVEQNHQIKWHQIRGFRNIIAHAYESVDPEVLWEAIDGDIPQLAKFCADTLNG